MSEIYETSAQAPKDLIQAKILEHGDKVEHRKYAKQYRTYATECLSGSGLGEAWKAVQIAYSSPNSLEDVLSAMMYDAVAEEIMRHWNDLSLKSRARRVAEDMKRISGVKFTSTRVLKWVTTHNTNVVNNNGISDIDNSIGNIGMSDMDMITGFGTEEPTGVLGTMFQTTTSPSIPITPALGYPGTGERTIDEDSGPSSFGTSLGNPDPFHLCQNPAHWCQNRACWCQNLDCIIQNTDPAHWCQNTSHWYQQTTYHLCQTPAHFCQYPACRV